MIVSSTVGPYLLDITQTQNGAVNSISVTPDTYGPGDSFRIEHMNVGSTAVLALIGKTIYTPGANVATIFDLPALEKLASNEPLRLTYTNVATEAMSVHVIVEYVGMDRIA